MPSLPELRLACPKCQHPFQPVQDDPTVMTCPQCAMGYKKQGQVWFPDELHLVGLVQETVQGFGDRWQKVFAQMEGMHHFFLPSIQPVEGKFFKDKIILDAGGGYGRLTRPMLDFGARHVVLMDLSQAVRAAESFLAQDCHQVTLVQGDILHPPLTKGQFDVVLCHGVLHHTGDPEGGIRALASLLKPSGTLILWVYAREGNGLTRFLINGVRSITRRLGEGSVWKMASLADWTLASLTRFVYRPLHQWFGIKNKLWYGPYLLDFLYSDNINNAMDRLQMFHDFMTSAIVEYYDREQLSHWFNDAGFRRITFNFYRQQSWGVCASFDPEETFSGDNKEP